MWAIHKWLLICRGFKSHNSYFFGVSYMYGKSDCINLSVFIYLEKRNRILHAQFSLASTIMFDADPLLPYWSSIRIMITYWSIAKRSLYHVHRAWLMSILLKESVLPLQEVCPPLPCDRSMLSSLILTARTRKWRFPKMEAAPNHPKPDLVSIETHGDLGILRSSILSENLQPAPGWKETRKIPQSPGSWVRSQRLKNRFPKRRPLLRVIIALKTYVYIYIIIYI